MNGSHIVFTCHMCGEASHGPEPTRGPVVLHCHACGHPMYFTYEPRPIGLSWVDLAVVSHLRHGHGIEEAFELAGAPKEGNYRRGAPGRLVMRGPDGTLQVKSEVLQILREWFPAE